MFRSIFVLLLISSSGEATNYALMSTLKSETIESKEKYIGLYVEAILVTYQRLSVPLPSLIRGATPTRSRFRFKSDSKLVA